MKPAANLIFFDETARERLSLLRKLLHDHDNALLKSFLQKSCALLRQEVALQSQQIKDKLPRFSTIVELVERSHDTEYPLFDYALLCIYQIGNLLV